MRLLIIIAMSTISATAWAEQELRFGGAALVVRIPDDWTAEQVAFVDGFQMFEPGGALIGSIILRDDTTCDALKQWSRDHYPFEISTAAPDGWTGRMYTHQDELENRGDYCRDATIDDAAFVIAVEGSEAELPGLMQLVDAGLAAAPAPRDAGSGVLALAATKLSVTIGPGWTTKLADGWDEIYDDEGTLAASVAYSRDPCDTALAKGAAGDITSAYDPGVAGWTGFQAQLEGGTTQLMFCRGATTPSGVWGGLIVITDDPMYTTLVVQAIEDALVKSLGVGATTKPVEPGLPPRRPGRANPAWFTFLPDRYEVGIARLTDGDTGSAFDEEGWGVSLNIERTLYGRGVPAWGYRVRGTPTGAGFAGHAEGTIGASMKGFSIGGVAGVGVAGEASPLSVHGGFHVGVLLQFLEIEGGYAWTPNGTVLRFEGGFLIPVGGWGAGIRFGYERREDSTMITIDWGAVRYPSGAFD